MMEPNKSYNQKPKTAFHISMALQDVRTSDGHPSQVFCIHKGQKYLLCTLQYPRVMQCTLDLYFDVSFLYRKAAGF